MSTAEQLKVDSQRTGRHGTKGVWVWKFTGKGMMRKGTVLGKKYRRRVCRGEKKR